MVELKSGDTYSGTLEQIDKFMNIKMNNVTMTSKVKKIIIFMSFYWILSNFNNIQIKKKDGESFLSIKEIYIKGFTVKYFQL